MAPKGKALKARTAGFPRTGFQTATLAKGKSGVRMPNCLKAYFRSKVLPFRPAASLALLRGDRQRVCMCKAKEMVLAAGCTTILSSEPKVLFMLRTDISSIGLIFGPCLTAKRRPKTQVSGA